MIAMSSLKFSLVIATLNTFYILGGGIIEKPYQNCLSSNSATTNIKMLLDSVTKTCYAFGTRGPCGKNMIFYNHPLDRSGLFGFCDCDQGYRSEYPCSDYPMRRMIYVSSLKQCFPVYSQGPCKEGFWLDIRESDSQPECQPNPCRSLEISSDSDTSNNSINKFWFYDPLRKSCFQTQTRGYCPVKLTLEVTHDSHVPKCRRKICHGALSNFRSLLTCKPGSRYSYFFKGCVRSARYFGIG